MSKCFFSLQGLLLSTLLTMTISHAAIAQNTMNGGIQADTTKRFSFHIRDTALEDFLELFSKETGFRYSYASADIDKNLRVSCDVDNEPVYKILEGVLGRVGYSHRFIQNFISVQKDPRSAPRNGSGTPGPVKVRGQVIDDKGDPIGGVTVGIIGKPVTPQITSRQGQFEIDWPAGSTQLQLSGLQYITRHHTVRDSSIRQLVVLQARPEKLEEVVVKGYYKDSRRNNTGSVTIVTARQLGALTLNPLQSLQGRVPGLELIEGSGAPGSTVVPRIRGIQSIPVKPGPDNLLLNDPLQVWNNVPLLVGSKPVTRTQSAEGDPEAGSAAGGKGIQIATSADDIESISILKDADATSIYGSRGANGVVLITTRQGNVGKNVIELKAEQGFVESSFMPRRFNNVEYVAMRREAISAANVTATPANSPDLFKLDTNDYVNIPRLLAGGTAHLTAVHASLSGGDTIRRYRLSSNLYHEGTVLPGDFSRQRLSLYGNHQYRSPKRRFRSDVSVQYSLMDQRSPAVDPMQSIDGVPLLPQLKEATGNLVWKRDEFHFINPLGQLNNTNTSDIAYLIGNGQFDYKLTEALSLRTNLGYQSLSADEIQTLPIAAQDPELAVPAERSIARNRFSAWIIEPQLNWKQDWNKLRVGGLMGATLQQENNDWHVARNAGFTSDSLMNSGAAAPESHYSSDASQYRYSGIYGRGFANWHNRYIVNVTGRRDESSRFGIKRPGKFWLAVGTAWVFSQEQWIQKQVPQLTHGKLRFSYGSTGNDQLGDYTFMEYFLRKNNPTPGQVPLRANNNRLDWERNLKAEWGLELEWKDRYSLTVNYYRHTAKDQVIITNEPVSGEPLLSNAPVAVLNSGWEFALQSTMHWCKGIRWTSSFNLTLPRNELTRFDGLAQSAFAGALVVGQSLTVQQSYPNLGVDPSTGLFTVPPGSDPTRWPLINAGNFDPKFYGGWYNEWQWKTFSLSVLLDFREQLAISPGWREYQVLPPGRWSSRIQLSNHSPAVLSRWQKPGELAPLQRWTTANDAATRLALQYYTRSEAQFMAASYLRVRTVTLNWNLPADWVKRAGIKSVKVYMKGQNLWTFTHYKDGDPTLAAPFKLPSLRMVAAGLQVQF